MVKAHMMQVVRTQRQTMMMRAISDEEDGDPEDTDEEKQVGMMERAQQPTTSSECGAGLGAGQEPSQRRRCSRRSRRQRYKRVTAFEIGSWYGTSFTLKSLWSSGRCACRFSIRCASTCAYT